MPEREKGAAVRHRSRRATGSLAIAAVAGIALIAAGPHRGAPVVVWNASASSPEGLYLSVPGPPRTGEYVFARAPAWAAALAAARGYLPADVPLVKIVAARRGDRVCAARERVLVNGRLAAIRRRADRAGRPLPWWSGCRTLRAHEVLLLGLGDPASFDGRYFGLLGDGEVLACARLVWQA